MYIKIIKLKTNSIHIQCTLCIYIIIEKSLTKELLELRKLHNLTEIMTSEYVLVLYTSPD